MSLGSNNPLWAVIAYALAITTSALLLRFFPRLQRSVQHTGQQRFSSVDGLRGYLAFGVFVHHTAITWLYLHTGVFDVPKNYFYAQIGLASVALFFMITGFLFWGRLIKHGRHHDWLAFAVSRIFRLYPLYLPLLLVVILCVFYLQGWTFEDEPLVVAKQVLAWLVFDRPDINQYPQTGMLISNVTWTLGYEVFFYLALPLFGMVFVYRKNWKQAVLCLLGIYALYQVVGWEHSLKKHILMSFLGGIAAAYWVRRPQWVAWGQTRLAACIALMLLVVVLFMFRKSFATAPLLLLTVFFCIVASGNTLFGALTLRSIRWMGEISYSTYLLHGLLIWLLMHRLPVVMQWDIQQPLVFVALAAVASSLLIVISSLTFLFIEQPGMLAGKKTVRWLRQRTPLETSDPVKDDA